MASSGWNPTSMPARETQMGFILPDYSAGTSAAQSAQETSAEEIEQR